MDIVQFGQVSPALRSRCSRHRLHGKSHLGASTSLIGGCLRWGALPSPFVSNPLVRGIKPRRCPPHPVIRRRRLWAARASTYGSPAPRAPRSPWP